MKCRFPLHWAVMMLALATACVPARAQTTGGSLVVSSARVTVAGNGGAASYTIALGAEPRRVVVVRLEPAPSPSGLIAVSPSRMVFGRRNWSTPQTVTVTAVDNDDFGERTVTVTHTASGGKGSASVEVRIIGEGGGGGEAPITTGFACAAAVNDDGDPLPAAMLVRFGRTMAEQASDGIAKRVALARSPGPDRWSRRMAFWGRASRSRFDGREGTFPLYGEVAAGMLGADHARGRWLVGLALTRNTGEGGYRNAGTALAPVAGAPSSAHCRMKSSLTAAIPYASWRTSERLKLWGALGSGTGEVTLKPAMDDHSHKAGIDWAMAAGGLRGTLGSAGILGGAELGWSADALWTRTDSGAAHQLSATSGEAWRLRLGLEGTWAGRAVWGGTLTPSMETGLRYDGGDAETGFGLEVGAAADWRPDSAPGLSLGLEGRTLALHEDGNFEDWGLALTVSWDPLPETRRGFSASLRSNVGTAPSGGVAALLGPDAFPGAADSREGAWSAEIARGTGLGKGMVGSPYAALTGGNSLDGARLGYRIERDAPHAEDLNVDLWAEPAADGGGGSVGTGLDWRW